MSATTKKYLTFGIVLLAFAVSGWLGTRYLQGVREDVLKAHPALLEKDRNGAEVPASIESAE